MNKMQFDILRPRAAFVTMITQQTQKHVVRNAWWAAISVKGVKKVITIITVSLKTNFTGRARDENKKNNNNLS